jgi:1-acyl-sn-glycerol-3-phosphate acyltransferase
MQGYSQATEKAMFFRLVGKLASLGRLAFVLLWTFVCSFPAIVCVFISPRGALSPWFVRKIWVSGLFFVCGIRLESSGQENIDPKKTYIVMANHQSLWDIHAIFGSNPLNLRFICKRSLAWIPFFGWFLILAGFPLVDRSNRARAIASLNKAAEKISRGIPIAAFPEGTRSSDGKVGEFKKGPFMLALKAKVPIIPASITGSNLVLPAQSLDIRPGTIRIHYAKPIETKGLRITDKEKIMKEVRQVIKDNMDACTKDRGA